MKFDPIWAAFFGHGLLFAASLLFMAGMAPSTLGAWNIGIPLAVFVLDLAVSGALIRANPVNMLCPISWFYLACAVFFGFGPLAVPFGTAETAASIEISSGYPIDGYGIFQTNILNAAGICCVSGGILLGRWMFPWRLFRPELSLRNFDITHAERVLWLFLAVGGTAKYLFALPSRWGLIPWTLPGFIQQLSLMLTAAIIIVMFLVQRGVRRYVPVMYILIGSEIVTSLMTFSKTDILFTVIAIAAGRYLWSPSFRLLAISAVLTALLYGVFLSPFITYARETIRASGTNDISALMEGLGDYFSPTGKRPIETYQTSELQGWWARLDYSNYQKFAIDQYDAGDPGSSLEQAYYVFLPRILYPNKPSIGYGRLLSDLLNPGSSEWVQTAMGMFAEGYWNFGVMGVIAVSLWAGLVLAGYTRFTYSQLAKGRLAMLLISLCGVSVGQDPAGWYVADWIGGTGEVVVYGLILWFVFYGSSGQRRARMGNGSNLRKVVLSHKYPSSRG